MISLSCGCCSKNIDFDVNDINFAPTILPRKSFLNSNKNKLKGMKHSPQSIKIFEDKNLDNLFPDENLLISYGNILYDKNLDLNKLTGKEKHHKLNVAKIISSYIHSLMLIEIYDNNNILQKTQIYGYGSNENGQLGINYDPLGHNFYKDWNLINLDDIIDYKYIIEDINIGDDFSIITIKNVEQNILALYRFQISKEDQFDILSNNNDSIRKCIFKEKFDVNEYGEIKQACSFGNRIVVLTYDNALYMKGILYDMSIANEYKQCAKFNKNIIYFTMGMNNCLLLGEDSTIYAIGHNEYKEFGIPDDIESNMNLDKFNFCKSKKLNNEINNVNKNLKKCSYKNYNEKIFVNNFFKEKGLKIKKLSTGARHSMVLCTNGELYCFGDNSDGQCSGFEKVINEPTLIEFEDEDEFIIDINAGFNHSIAKGLSKKIFVWGDSTWGKIGIKETTIDQFDPLEINEMKIRNVVKIFSGPTHTNFFISGDFNLEN